MVERRLNEASSGYLCFYRKAVACKGCRETWQANDVRDNLVIAFRLQLHPWHEPYGISRLLPLEVYTSFRIHQPFHLLTILLRSARFTIFYRDIVSSTIHTCKSTQPNIGTRIMSFQCERSRCTDNYFSTFKLFSRHANWSGRACFDTVLNIKLSRHRISVAIDLRKPAITISLSTSLLVIAILTDVDRGISRNCHSSHSCLNVPPYLVYFILNSCRLKKIRICQYAVNITFKMNVIRFGKVSQFFIKIHLWI